MAQKYVPIDLSTQDITPEAVRQFSQERSGYSTGIFTPIAAFSGKQFAVKGFDRQPLFDRSRKSPQWFQQFAPAMYMTQELLCLGIGTDAPLNLAQPQGFDTLMQHILSHCTSGNPHLGTSAVYVTPYGDIQVAQHTALHHKKQDYWDHFCSVAINVLSACIGHQTIHGPGAFLANIDRRKRNMAQISAVVVRDTQNNRDIKSATKAYETLNHFSNLVLRHKFITAAIMADTIYEPRLRKQAAQYIRYCADESQFPLEDLIIDPFEDFELKKGSIRAPLLTPILGVLDQLNQCLLRMGVRLIEVPIPYKTGGFTQKVDSIRHDSDGKTPRDYWHITYDQLLCSLNRESGESSLIHACSYIPGFESSI